MSGSKRSIDVQMTRFRTMLGFLILLVTVRASAQAGFNTGMMWKGSTLTCGDTAANNCYTGLNAAPLQAIGQVTTPGGKNLVYVFANGSSGFKVWKDSGSNKVLRANGIDQWAMTLNVNGRGQTVTVFNDANLGTVSTLLAGRSCPNNVYIDDSNKFTTGNCLYYDQGNAAQAYSAAGTSQTTLGQIGLSTWSTAAWYCGNLDTCAQKGMRVPTLFETKANAPGQYTPTTDGTPVYAGSKGVPSYGSGSWTASAFIVYANEGWQWNGTTASSNSAGYMFGLGSWTVRCVLP